MDSDKSQRLIVKFSNSGVLQTYARNPELIAELSSNRDKYPLLWYSSKIVHTAKYGYELVTDTDSEPPQWVDALRSNFEIPSGALLRQLTTSGAIFGVRWQYYNIRYIGISIDIEKRQEQIGPFWHITDIDGNDLEHVQVWYRRVSCLTSPVYCDIHWHPNRGETVSFPNSENARRAGDLRKAWRGRILLERINPRGRPESSAKLNTSQFIKLAPRVCARLMDTFGDMPTDVQIAEELHISRATLYRYMERDNLSLNQIRDSAVRLLIEPTPF